MGILKELFSLLLALNAMHFAKDMGIYGCSKRTFFSHLAPNAMRFATDMGKYGCSKLKNRVIARYEAISELFIDTLHIDNISIEDCLVPRNDAVVRTWVNMGAPKERFLLTLCALRHALCAPTKIRNFDSIS